ncbi:adenosine deaminase [soil metagenome]
MTGSDQASSEAFIAALEMGDLEGVRRAPKAESHTHGPFGGDRTWLAERSGRDIAPVTQPLASMDEMDAWTAAHVGDLFKGKAGRQLGWEGAFVRARRDGLTRVEFGDDVWSITQGVGDAAQLFADIEAARTAIYPDIHWIPQLGFSRHCKRSWLWHWLTPFLEAGGWRALDLSGDEFAQPIETFQPLYRACKDHGMRLKAHVGEWGTADDVWRAVEVLELDEVQHGIAAASSPEVMRFLADHAVTLNVCPTSNLLLGRVARLEDHPIRALYDAGVRVTINSDDTLVFGVGVSEEFLALHQAGVFTGAELDQIRRWSLEAKQNQAR